MDTRNETFADRLRRRSAEILGEAAPAMTRLSALAEAMKMEDAQAALQAGLTGLRNPEFNMMVFGRFKNGKSTFLNTLLMPTTDRPHVGDGGPPLIMGPDPATARLTTVRYGDTPTATICYRDGRRVLRTVNWYREHCELYADEKANRAAFDDILEIEIAYPFENGRAGIVLVDTPGTDEDTDRDAVVQRAVLRADAGVVVFSSMAAFGKGEIGFVKDLNLDGLTQAFYVINCFGREPDEKLRHRTWDKLVHEMRGGPRYAGQDFGTERIYFVDAFLALEGRLAGDDDKVRRSGLTELESALNRFYETERRKVHVRRWTDLADRQAAAMLDFIDGIVPMITRDQASFRSSYEAIRPRIAEARAGQARVPKLFNVFRERAVSALTTSFQELVNSIRLELPGHLKAAQLIEMENLADKAWATLSSTKRDRAVAECYQIAKAYVESRVKHWDATDPMDQATTGANRVLEPLINELLDDLRAEVQQTEREFAKLQFSLAGYEAVAADRLASADDGSWWGRVIPAVAGLVFGPDMAVMGAAQGWRGFGKGVLVHVGVLGTIALFASNPLGWAAAAGWIAAFVIRSVWQGHDLADEIRNKVIEAVISGDPKQGRHGLQDEVTNARPKLAHSVLQMTEKFEAEFCKAFAAEIDQKVKQFEESQRQNALAADEKEALLTQYTLARAEILTHRATLDRVSRGAANV